MMKRYSVIVLFALLGCSPSSHADDYIKDDEIDVAGFANPPIEGSEEDRADLDAVLAAQSARTDADCRRATGDAHLEFSTAFQAPVGPLTADEIDKAESFFEKFSDEGEDVLRDFKKRWDRPRPFARDARITPCVPLPSSASYPSGHAVVGRLSGKVLALVFPAKAEALLARGNQIGTDRVLGGAHHPADIAAGQDLAERIYSALQASSKFQRDVRSLKGER